MSLPFDDGSHLPVSGATASAQLRVSRLAAQLPVHRAFGWLHLHAPQLRLWQLEFLSIPAPPFHEDARARWFLARFEALGLTNCHIDEAGNVLGEIAAADLGASLEDAGVPPDGGSKTTAPVILLSAHLDTVFPPGVETVPAEVDGRILCPGACDNGAGLTGLLAAAAALRAAGVVPPATILFAANVGEEGEGDLRGMRHLFERGAYRGRIAAALALEGSGTASAVTRALGSRRFRVTFSGPGGHSWTDAGAPNPISLLAEGLTILAAQLSQGEARAEAEKTRTVLSPGTIRGGTSVNAIPESAEVLLDLRSTDAHTLERWTLEVHRTFETVLAASERRANGYPAAQLRVELVGSRPAAELPLDSPLLHSLRAVDRHLGLRTEVRLGSTDSNLPLALGVAAAALPAGGAGGGIHTLGEWYDPAGRETALRRMLLVLLDLASIAPQLVSRTPDLDPH